MSSILKIFLELLLGTLAQYSSEITRQIKKFQDEADRLASSKSLSEQEKDLLVDKYSIVFSRILYVTTIARGTLHEEMCQKKYGKLISSVLDRVRSPADWANPIEGWGALAQLQHQLAARSGKRNFSLQLSEISPSLYNLRDTGDTCDLIAAEFAKLFFVQPTRVREMKTQHVLSINHQLEKWNNEMLATMQRYSLRMMV